MPKSTQVITFFVEYFKSGVDCIENKPAEYRRIGILKFFHFPETDTGCANLGGKEIQFFGWNLLMVACCNLIYGHHFTSPKSIYQPYSVDFKCSISEWIESSIGIGSQKIKPRLIFLISPVMVPANSRWSLKPLGMSGIMLNALVRWVKIVLKSLRLISSKSMELRLSFIFGYIACYRILLYPDSLP